MYNQDNPAELIFEVKSKQPLKRQTKIAADDILIFYFYLSKKIRPSRRFTWNIKSYFLWKRMKKYLWISSAAVVIGALRVNLWTAIK